MTSLKGSRSSRYTPGNPPNGDRWLREELERIADALQSPVPMVFLDVLHKAPDRLPTDRVPVVFADGTNWDPGSGAGLYCYQGGVWQALSGGGGGGGLSTEDVDDRVASLLVAGSNISLTYDDAGNALTIAGTGIPQTLRVSVNFGSGWSDKAQTVVTGQTWVTANSEITAQVLTPSGTDPDEMYLLGLRAEVSDLVAGTGFTVTVYSQAEATGIYSVMVIGN